MSITHIAQVIRHLFKIDFKLGPDPMDQDINLAMGELLELEKKRDILVVVPGIGAWTIPYSETTLKELALIAETGNTELLANYAGRCRGSAGLVSMHRFVASHYCEVIVA